MDAPNRNTLWANIFVDELARAGLRSVCIAPGSRSTPLTVAFAGHPAVQVYSLLDERGAAFVALGKALAGGRPVALLCTSGTAAANFYPAIIEANMSRVPLLVLTTDRPPELRHSGANQTIDQVKLYGDQVRWFVDVALPEANPLPLAVRSLRTLAARAVAKTRGLPPGPVHLNFPFRKPLEPVSVEGDAAGPVSPPREQSQPFARMSRGRLVPSPEQNGVLANAIRQSPRGLIVCGPRCPGGDFPLAVVRLAEVSGYLVLADALSGVRFGPHFEQGKSVLLAGYETFLQEQVVSGWQPPDLILRFGAMPISKMLGQYIGRATGARHIQISGSGVWQDDTHTTSDYVWADPEATCFALSQQLATMSSEARDELWMSKLRQAEALVWASYGEIQEKTFFEGVILPDIIGMLPHNATLFVSSSLPVRHMDQFTAPNAAKFRVFANRGASGIDGTLASAVGAATTSAGPTVLVIGDLAFYHDLNSMLALQRCQAQLTIVLINNNGGGIFHRLPIANFEPPFTELFVTPHGLDFEPAVRMFGADFVRTNERDTFRQMFRESLAGSASRVIELPTDSVQHERTRRSLIESVVREMAASP